MRERLAPIVLATMSIAAVLMVWELAGLAGYVNPILAPRPSLIIARCVELLVSGDLFAPLAHTLALFAAGYCVASLLGIAFGIAMGTSPSLYGLFEPLVEILRPIPKPALVPALFLFLGIGKTTMITVVVLAAIFPILINTLQGVRGLDPILLDTARTFRISTRRKIFDVILPGVMPMILAGMRIGLGLGLVLAILAEMLAGESGLGFLILDLQRSFEIKDMFAWILVLAVIGGGLAFAFDRIERRIVPWRGHG